MMSLKIDRLNYQNQGEGSSIPELYDDVSFEVYLSPDEVGEKKSFPPSRFNDRDNRLCQLRDLWRGKLLDVKLGANPVPINHFQVYSRKIADLLLMSIPQAQGVDPSLLRDMGYDAIVDLTRYGGAVLTAMDGELSVVSPTSWYPTREEGDFLVSTYLSDRAENTTHDRVQVIHITPTGGAIRTDYEWDGSTIGSALSGSVTGSGRLLTVARDPRQGQWGTAKYLELYPPLVEIAKRYSTNSRVLDIYTKPLPVFKDSESAAESRYSVPMADDYDERRKAILEGQLDMLVGETLFLDDTLLALEFEQPSTQGVVHSLLQVDSLMEVVREISGLPNLMGRTLSGEALKRLFFPWFAESSSLQTSVRMGMEQLLGREVVWPHVFDTDMFAEQVQDGPVEPNLDGVADITSLMDDGDES